LTRSTRLKPPPRPASAPGLELDEDERTGRAPERLGREPWSYGFLGIVAGLLIAAALAFSALLLALGLMAALSDIDRGRPGGVLLFGCLLGVALYVVLFVGLGALILLLVDIARNVRRIRANTHRG
jgi:hypothetical protein